MLKKVIIILVLIIVILCGGWFFLNNVEISTPEPTIEDTANQIAEIKRIGQWQFLNFDCEVLIDTVRSHSFLRRDDRLARIYKGSLKIGVNLQKAKEGWIEHQGDTLVNIILPPIELLDDRFIDEANTKTFYEEGKWDAKAKEAMYRRARTKMLSYISDPEYMEMARQQAVHRFESLFKAMGFKEVNVTFADLK